MENIVDLLSSKVNILSIERRLSYKAFKRSENLDSWIGLIPKSSNCEVCGSEVSFHSRDKSKAIHFDHRSSGAEPIIGNPTNWLQYHPRNDKNEKIWKECNFGILCGKCNRFLPTKDRERFVQNLVKYTTPR